MYTSFRYLRPRVIIHIGTAIFAGSIAFAYALYPHWVTLSHFVTQPNTLILFIFAMLIAMFELGYIATRVRGDSGSKAASNFLYASAFFIALVVCVPYLGIAAQKNIHNLVALLFAISAGAGFATLARRLRSYILGVLSGLIFIICILELVLLARYATHPVRPWVWTVLELAAIASLIVGLDIIAVIVGKIKEPTKLKPLKQG